VFRVQHKLLLALLKCFVLRIAASCWGMHIFKTHLLHRLGNTTSTDLMLLEIVIEALRSKGCLEF
jgi:hypothetical protein